MTLRDYLQKLFHHKDVKRILSDVNSDLEIAAMCRSEFTSESGGSALLFEAVRGTSVRVAANLFGTKERLLRMLDLDEGLLTQKIRTMIHSGAQDAAGNLTAFCNTSSMGSAPAEYPLRDLTLKDIPGLRSWPGEKDRYLTLALTHTVSPDSGTCNLGLYRAALVGDREIALNFAIGSGADGHLKLAEERGEPLPVALILGTDPVLFWAAAAPLPGECSEYGFAQALSGRAIKLSDCLTQPLSVPANAEILIEGEIRPGDRIKEGPFGNHTGQYVERADCPLMTVTAIRHRGRPIMPTTVVGPPPSENIRLAHLNEALLREMLCYDFPLITDMAMPERTIFHGAAIISVRECSAEDVADLIPKLTSLASLGRSRLLVLLDDDINIRDYNSSWWRFVNLLSPERVTSTDRGLIINATGVDRKRLVTEDPGVTALVHNRQYEIAPDHQEQQQR